MRLTLTVMLLVFMVSLPPLIPEWTTAATMVTLALEFACFLGVVGMWLPRRPRIAAFRGLGLFTFLLFGAYFTVELLSDGWTLPTRRSESSSGNALIGLLAFGLPGLGWAIFGEDFWEEERDDEDPDWDTNEH